MNFSVHKIFYSIRINIFYLMLVTMGMASSETLTKEKFLEAWDGGFVTEMGSFGTNSGNDAELGAYIMANWRTLLDGLDTLPPPKKGKGVAIAMIGLASEDLPPVEYLDFLEKYMDLVEAKKIAVESAGLQLMGRARKSHFIGVNWENPRVKAILERALKLVPDESNSLHVLFRKQLDGKLAENYRIGESDDTPPPETLPGIKLRSPDQSFFERVHDATFEDSKRGAGLRATAGHDEQNTEESHLRPVAKWAIAGSLILLVAAVLMLLRSRHRNASK